MAAIVPGNCLKEWQRKDRAHAESRDAVRIGRYLQRTILPCFHQDADEQSSIRAFCLCQVDLQSHMR